MPDGDGLEQRISELEQVINDNFDFGGSEQMVAAEREELEALRAQRDAGRERGGEPGLNEELEVLRAENARLKAQNSDLEVQLAAKRDDYEEECANGTALSMRLYEARNKIIAVENDLVGASVTLSDSYDLVGHLDWLSSKLTSEREGMQEKIDVAEARADAQGKKIDEMQGWLDAQRDINGSFRDTLRAVEEKIIDIENTQFGGHVASEDLVKELDWLDGEITADRNGMQKDINKLKEQMLEMDKTHSEQVSQLRSDVIYQSAGWREAKEELSQWQWEMVNLCRVAHLNPRIDMSDPSYYGDMLDEAIGELQAEVTLADPNHLIDPKGRVVIETFEVEGHALPDAVVFCGPQAVEPFVVAHGYDETDGEWLSGTYFTDVGYAHDKADPEIIEDATSRWCLDDIRKPLLEEGLAASAYNIQEVLTPSGIGSSFSELVNGDAITSELNEDIAATVHWMKDMGRFEEAPANKQERVSGDALRDNSREGKGFSLDSQCAAASKAKEDYTASREAEGYSLESRANEAKAARSTLGDD